MMNNAPAIVAAVEDAYRCIDAEIALWLPPVVSSPHSCSVCGKCCDFDVYDHRLFVTSPELVYLLAKVGRANILPMAGGMCPYNLNSRCNIHPHRFAGCRIFFCKGDADKQAQLSEWTSARFKTICRDLSIPYRYVDLKTGLGMLVAGDVTG
jgi:Fe-S-cluster containining protein